MAKKRSRTIKMSKKTGKASRADVKKAVKSVIKSGETEEKIKELKVTWSSKGACNRQNSHSCLQNSCLIHFISFSYPLGLCVGLNRSLRLFFGVNPSSRIFSNHMVCSNFFTSISSTSFLIS